MDFTTETLKFSYVKLILPLKSWNDRNLKNDLERKLTYFKPIALA